MAQTGQVRMAIHLREELRCRKTAVDHVAFELGHVHAIGGETTQRFVERGRDVAHVEHESGHEVRGFRVQDQGLAGHDVEACGVYTPAGGTNWSNGLQEIQARATVLIFTEI